MPRLAPWHPRIYPAPFAELVFDARLDAISEEPRRERGNERDILVDISALATPTRLSRVACDGAPAERVRGERAPYRLRFRSAAWLRRGGPFANLDALPLDADARRLFYLLHLREAQTGPRYVFVTDVGEPAELALRARGVELERREGPTEPVDYLRRYLAPPSPPARLVPRPLQLHARHGGDPIRVRLGGRMYARRLFIGGLHHQRSERPAVDHVVNLGDIESAWALLAGRRPNDRFAPKREMRVGMTPDELLAEAQWIAGALRAGRTVLVHCVAGFNRSSSACCAALMLLEGLRPEAALARVRERHPEAHPDPYHWFALRQLDRRLSSGGRRVSAYLRPVVVVG